MKDHYERNMLKFTAPLILVEELARSRRFYEQLLGQQVKYDFGEDIEFEGGFSIHLKSHFQSLLGQAVRHPTGETGFWGELYFQTNDLDPYFRSLEEAGVEFIHPVKEQPWGQRTVRLYDPDGHIIEIGESMEAVVWRLHQLGEPLAAIAEKCSMPLDFIEGVIREGGANS